MTAILRAMRPWQWAKNLLIFAPLVFAQRVGEIESLGRAVAAFVIFCMLASGVYLMNDVMDREQDRLHPKKRLRPIAAGTLSVPLAVALSIALIGGAFAGSLFGLGSQRLALVCVIYIAIQVLYSWRLKRVVIVDVLCIASGFVLRLLAGGFAVDVPQSTWILLCTTFASLLLALCKRRHEVVTLGDDAAEHRSSLGHYPHALLDQLISAATSATLVTYALYTVDERTLMVHNLRATGDALPVLTLTIPFVLYGVFRYLYLVYKQDAGGDPASTLLRDPPSVANIVLYLGAAWLAIQVVGQ